MSTFYDELIEFTMQQFTRFGQHGVKVIVVEKHLYDILFQKARGLGFHGDYGLSFTMSTGYNKFITVIMEKQKEISPLDQKVKDLEKSLESLKKEIIFAKLQKHRSASGPVT